jgi:tripartite-type tricarboxylate transporter receptor subunit TctC
MAPMAGMLPLYREGRVKILAVGSTTRVAELPDVPTFRELGYPEELVLTVWYALMAPPKTPDPIAERLNKAVNEIVRQPEAQERYRSLAIDPVGGAQPLDLMGYVGDDQVNAVPAAWLRLAAIRHCASGRARPAAEQEPQAPARDIGKCRRCIG